MSSLAHLLPENALVAIVGGGISGLTLAQKLAQHNIRSHVFDTGRTTVGGRCSSRVLSLSKSQKVTVDHAVQVFGGALSQCSEGVRELIADMEAAAVVRKMESSEVRVVAGSSSSAPNSTISRSTAANEAQMQESQLVSRTTLYCASDPNLGSGGIAKFLADSATKDPEMTKLFLRSWISKVYFDEWGEYAKEKKWYLEDKKGWREQGYSHLVFAHCGKCAVQLINTSNVGPTRLHSLLACRFVAGFGIGSDTDRTVGTVAKGKGAKGKGKGGGAKSVSDSRLDITSIFSLVVMMPRSRLSSTIIEDHVSVLSIDSDPILKLAASNTRRFTSQSAQDSSSNSVEVWTLLSTSQFASANKCPQENIPHAVREKVTGEMLEAFARILDLVANDSDHVHTMKDGYANTKNSDQIESLHLQLWGAALPANVLTGGGRDAGCVYEETFQLGLVGDWLVNGSVEGAMESGYALGEQLARMVTSTRNSTTQSGVNGSQIPAKGYTFRLAAGGGGQIVQGLGKSNAEATLIGATDEIAIAGTHVHETAIASSASTAASLATPDGMETKDNKNKKKRWTAKETT